MKSLKAFTQRFDDLAEATKDGLYERQRALVRLGMLIPLPGRGRGSGVPLNASNLSALIGSMLATDRLSEVDTRVARLCDSKPSPGPACPFTGATNFRDALAAIIGSTKRAKLTLSLSLDREKLEPEILFRAKRKVVRSHFRPRGESSRYPFLRTVVTLESDALFTLARLLEHELAEHEE